MILVGVRSCCCAALEVDCLLWYWRLPLANHLMYGAKCSPFLPSTLGYTFVQNENIFSSFFYCLLGVFI